jgi:hypothetical protein
MVIYLQTSNLAGAMHTTSGSPKRTKKKEKQKGKAIRAKENPTKVKAADWAASYIGTPTISWHTNANAPTEHEVSSAVHELVDDAAEQQLDDTVSIHSRTSARSSASVSRPPSTRQQRLFAVYQQHSEPRP